MAENTDADCLIEREFYENCPGCKVDRLNREHKGIPYKNLSYIWFVSLCTALPLASLFPFLYFMVRDFHIAKEEEEISFYAGFVGSSFMLGRALTSVFWGWLADRYGRKPILLIGTFSVVIFNALFGLSTSLWMAICTRFVLGCFNSVLGTIRAYASEICSEEHRALGLSVASTSRGIGLVIGPAIGGFFAQPADKYPDIFSKSSIFGRFPYFLPCFLISIYALGVFIACWWLPETLHMHNKNLSESRFPCDVEASEENSDGKESMTRSVDTKKVQKPNLLNNWPFMSMITAYCVFSLQEIAYSEVFSLWAVSDKKYGGLNFSSQDVGEVLAISAAQEKIGGHIIDLAVIDSSMESFTIDGEILSNPPPYGVGLLVFQLLLYPPIEKILGPLAVSRLSAAISIPVLSSYPYIAMLSGLYLHVAINCASILRNTLSVSLITGFFILLNNAVPQSQRAAANGISLTAMSVFKTFGPAGAGALFSWSQKRQFAAFLPGSQIVFFTLNLVMFIGLILTFKPFMVQPHQGQDNS